MFHPAPPPERCLDAEWEVGRACTLSSQRISPSPPQPPLPTPGACGASFGWASCAPSSTGSKYFAGFIGVIAIRYDYLSGVPLIKFCRSWRAVPLGLSVQGGFGRTPYRVLQLRLFQTTATWLTVTIKNHKALLPWGLAGLPPAGTELAAAAT